MTEFNEEVRRLQKINLNAEIRLDCIKKEFDKKMEKEYGKIKENVSHQKNCIIEKMKRMEEKKHKLKKDLEIKEIEKNIRDLGQRKSEIEMLEKKHTEIEKLQKEIKDRKEKINDIRKKDELPADAWRCINYSHKNDLTEKVKTELMKEFDNLDNKMPTFPKFVNILLLGGTGSGKSSFINSCATAVLNLGRLVFASSVVQGGSESATKQFKLVPLRRKGHDVLPVRVFDTRGMTTKGHDDIGQEEIKFIIDGHLKANAYITSKSEMMKSTLYYRENPGLGDKMHCIVYVIRADMSESDDSNCLKEINTIKKTVLEKEIPQLVLITAVDKIMEKMKIDKFFQYPCVQNLCEFYSKRLSLPASDILPMSNYFEEGTPSVEKDCLALYNLHAAVTRGMDYLTQRKECDSRIPDGFFD